MTIFRRLWQVFKVKKSIFFLCFYGLAFLVIVINSAYLVLDNVYVDISDVPSGEYKRSVYSPSGVSELKVYVVETDIGNGVRITQTKNGKTNNIFWQTNVSSANIYWQDEDSVIINGIMLELAEGDVFDSRYMRSIFNDGLMGWDK